MKKRNLNLKNCKAKKDYDKIKSKEKGRTEV